jgi:hypothetical protein
MSATSKIWLISPYGSTTVLVMPRHAQATPPVLQLAERHQRGRTRPVGRSSPLYLRWYQGWEQLPSVFQPISEEGAKPSPSLQVQLIEFAQEPGGAPGSAAVGHDFGRLLSSCRCPAHPIDVDAITFLGCSPVSRCQSGAAHLCERCSGS